MDTAENDILEVPQSLDLIRRAGSSLIERKPLRVRLSLYRCPYCGGSRARRPSRLKGLEKAYGRVLHMRRCRDCGHRFFAPFLLCVRPSTFWAALGLLTALVFCWGVFALITGFVPQPPAFKETKYYSWRRSYNSVRPTCPSISAARPQSSLAGPTESA